MFVRRSVNLSNVGPTYVRIRQPAAFPYLTQVPCDIVID